MSEIRKDLYISNMRLHNGVVLSHGLFGESSHLPDVMHCEPIAARSALHDWELAPHRHDRLHQLLLLKSGTGTAHLDGQALALGPLSLINVPAGNVHAFTFEPGTQGLVVTLADEMLATLLAGADDVRLALGQAFVGEGNAAMAAVAQQLWQEFKGLRSARALVLRGLCATLLGLAARVGALAHAAQQGHAGRPELLQRFEKLVEAHYLAHWGVAQYAQALAISPTHLSRLVRAATGEPASRLIEARVIREARRNLAYTNLRIATIADALGYADPAHFSRAFTRTVGVSPRQFRQQLLKPPPQV